MVLLLKGGELMINILIDLLSSAAILVGIIALTGLVLQKKTTTNILEGTIKTIVGFLVFTAGTELAVKTLDSFQKIFGEGFGLEGVLPLAEAITALAQERFATVVALIMGLGFIANLIVARITRFKYIFLTGQHNLYMAALLTIILKATGANNVTTVVVGSIVLGLSAAIFPAIAQPTMRKVTGGDDIALGHYVSIGYALSGWLGSKVGSPEESTEDLKLPSWLSIFKDYVISVGLTVVILFYISAFAAGQSFVEEQSGGMNWLVFPLIEGLTFAGALYIVITGVRMFLGEIVAAFTGISERLIPNAKPALDVPVTFPYAPTATIVGFISAYIGGLLSMGIFYILKLPVIIPVAVPYFFIGATAGVFGNARGGWKGAIVGSFVVGILIAVGPALVYPIMGTVGLKGTAFPETDFNLIGLLVYYISKFISFLFG